MSTSPERQFRKARIWSNKELERLAPLFSGDIVNVSGWDDRDKEGRRYRDYFTNAKSYSITNYAGERGFQGEDGEISLDLEKPLPADLGKRFDTVFNHTTLEHIFDVLTAFSNLCRMSRDAVIVVVPFAQVEHWSSSYGDYWRISGQALEKLFQREGFSMVYCSANSDTDSAVYVIGIGVRDASAWKGRLPEPLYERPLANWLGRKTFFERIRGRFGL